MLQALNREAEEQLEKHLDSMIWDTWLHKYEGEQSFGDYKRDFTERLEKQMQPKPKVTEPENMARNLSIATETLNKLRTTRKGGE